ncbi:MAG: hypothetical protein K9L28_06705 [Synergistales bacterium]|nr:hypothetical protein [Synergistales bacterium]
MLLVVLLLALCASRTAAQEGVLRWLPPYTMAIPRDWKPFVERNVIGYFTGALPGSEAAAEGAAMAGITTTRQPAPKDGDYRSFFAEIEKELRRETTRNVRIDKEEISLGGRPAMSYAFSGEVEIGGSFRAVEGNMVVGTEPDSQGRYPIVSLMGTASSIAEHRGAIDAALSSAEGGTPPLEEERAFGYGATRESFRHTVGPAAAMDGAIALADSSGSVESPKIRIFDARGERIAQWGSRGKGEPGTFSYPQALAFGPDGSLYVADKGYSVKAHVQRFTREGKPLKRLKLDRESLGEKGIYNPSHLAVTASGNVVVVGATEITKGTERVLVLSAEGELQSAWEIGETLGIAALPGDRIVAVVPRPGNDRAEMFAVYSLEGEKLLEWPYYGSDLPSTPGDEEVYFSPEEIAADSMGRIYVYDDSSEAIWIYGPRGDLRNVLPTGKTYGIVMGMAVTPAGHLVIQDRPGGYSPGEPQLHLLRNAAPAQTVEQTAGSPGTAPESVRHLQQELDRLRKALAFLEEAAALEERGNRRGALAAYRESLKLHPVPELEAYIAALAQRVPERDQADAGDALHSLALFVSRPPAPETLEVYRGRRNTPLSFTITGRTTGTVWGSGVYADTSDPGTAAVHAGLLQPGERGTLTVILLPGREGYLPSTQNGVTTQPLDRCGGSFVFTEPPY